MDELQAQEGEALNAAGLLIAADDLGKAQTVLVQAASLNGPLTSEISRRIKGVEESVKDPSLRELRRREEQSWQRALKSMDEVYSKLEEAALYIDRNPAIVKSITSFPGQGRLADTSAAAGKCLLDTLGMFAEFETNLRKERQLEGIAKAKERGVYKGRPTSIDAAAVRELKAQGMRRWASLRRSASTGCTCWATRWAGRRRPAPACPT